MSEQAAKLPALIIAAFSSFLTPFMVSAVNIALPSIERDLHTDAIGLSWVATSYLLAAAICLLPFGKLADIYGRKKVFLIGLILFSVASLLCGLSMSAPMLIGFRILQGAGTAMIFATSIAIVSSVFPSSERGKVLGITVAAVYGGLSCGPFFGGLLTQYYSWRSIFVIAVPLGIWVVCLVVFKLKGEWIGAREESFDVVGAIIYGVGISALMVGISVLPALYSFAVIGIGALALIMFVRWETVVTNPVFDVRLFRGNRVFTYSCLAALIHYSATFAVTFLLSLYLQYIKGLTAQNSGLILVFQPVIMALFSPLAGRLSDRIEPRLIASLGMALTCSGLLLLTLIRSGTSLAYLVMSLMILGFGFALFSSPNMNAIMSAVDKRFYGIASGSVGTMRLLGQMFSMGIATVVFALFIGRVEITPQYYPALVTCAQTAFAVFAGLCAGGIYFSLSRGRLHAISP